MNQLSTTSALFPRAVSRVAVVLTFAFALVSAPQFAQAVSSKSNTRAGKPSSAG